MARWCWCCTEYLLSRTSHTQPSISPPHPRLPPTWAAVQHHQARGPRRAVGATLPGQHHDAAVRPHRHRVRQPMLLHVPAAGCVGQGLMGINSMQLGTGGAAAEGALELMSAPLLPSRQLTQRPRIANRPERESVHSAALAVRQVQQPLALVQRQAVRHAELRAARRQLELPARASHKNQSALTGAAKQAISAAKSTRSLAHCSRPRSHPT